MSVLLGALLLATAAICWLVAAVSWVLAVRHRKPEVSLASLLLSGLRAFDPSNFTDEGRPHQRRFVIGFACFFAAALAGAIASALGAR